MRVFKIVTPSTRTEEKTEVTRWVVKKELGVETWKDLTNKLQKLLKTRSTQFYLSWFDGNDYCTIHDYHDLEEAVEYFNELNQTDKAVRIYASPDKREHHTIFGDIPEENEEELPVSEVSTADIEDHCLVDFATSPVEEIINPLEHETEESDSEVSVTEEEPKAPVQQPYIGGQYPTVPYPVFYPTPLAMGPYPVQAGGWPMTAYPQPMVPTMPPQAAPVVPSAPEQRTTLIAEDPQSSRQPIRNTPTKEPEVAEATVSAPAAPRKSITPESTPAATPQMPKGNYIDVALITLRSMGFTHDDKKLRKLIKVKKGNLNEIIDKLQRQEI